MFKRKTIGYVSEIDRLLEQLNESLPLSKSQLAEVTKHERIFKLRDKAMVEEKKPDIWEEFD